jgi:hypothetical protein
VAYLFKSGPGPKRGPCSCYQTGAAGACGYQPSAREAAGSRARRSDRWEAWTTSAAWSNARPDAKRVAMRPLQVRRLARVWLHVDQIILAQLVDAAIPEGATPPDAQARPGNAT